ncbi:hypothetical protein [Spirosoma litoris]
MPKSTPTQDQQTDPASDVVGVQRKTYQIVGLEMSDYMPIRFDGVDYNLANLTADEVDFLVQHPDQVPYLKAV